MRIYDSSNITFHALNAVQAAVVSGSTNTLLSAEGCGCLAEGLRFDCGHYTVHVFAVVESQKNA